MEWNADITDEPSPSGDAHSTAKFGTECTHIAPETKVVRTPHIDTTRHILTREVQLFAHHT